MPRPRDPRSPGAPRSSPSDRGQDPGTVCQDRDAVLEVRREGVIGAPTIDGGREPIVERHALADLRLLGVIAYHEIELPVTVPVDAISRRRRPYPSLSAAVLREPA